MGRFVYQTLAGIFGTGGAVGRLLSAESRYSAIARIITMKIDVIVLSPRTTQVVETWQYATDSNGQFFTLHEYGQRLLPQAAWQKLAVKLNQLDCNDEDMPGDVSAQIPVNVFLIIRDRLIENLHEYKRLEKIINDAHDYTWGGKIYIAWDQSKDIFNENNRTALKEWFLMLSQSGVTDLIEIPKNRRKSELDENKILHDYGVESERRFKSLRKLISADGWGAVVPDEAYSLEYFIDGLVTAELLPAHSKNQAVLYYPRPRQRGLTPLLQKSRNRKCGGSLFVAFVPGVNARDVEELWKPELPVLKPVIFNGAFEWLYALLRLNQAGCPAPSLPLDLTATDYKDYIVEVEPSAEERFKPKPNDAEVRLLVTSSFHPTLEESQCIDAAKEIGAALRRLPFHIDVDIHPCITCEHLPGMLERKLFTAWLHIGHGERAGGLYEATTGEFVSAARWLACWHAYRKRGSLQLVFLSACESAAIAKLFAAAGVRVALGFEHIVITDATRILTERIIPAALQAGDRQSAILGAFQAAYHELHSRTFLQDGKEIRYSEAWPKAFIA